MILIREMQRHDMERLLELSPSAEGQGEGNVKNPGEFVAYPTIVAVAPLEVAQRMVDNGEVPASAVSPDGLVVGYAQWSLGPDKILHSLAIRVSRKFKGLGIGALLVAERIRLARAAGSTFHLYAVERTGEKALKKILLGQGMHLCRVMPDLFIYAQDLAVVVEEEDPGYTEPEWEEEESCGRHGEVCA